MKKIFTLCVVALMAVTMSAKPYQHSIGMVAGSGIGVQYKTMLMDHFTLMDEFGYLGCYAAAGKGWTMGYMGAVDQLVLAYQNHAVEGQGISLDYYVGGQLKGGYINVGADAGVFGVGAAAGIEANMQNAPIAFSFDFRPGYGGIFAGGRSLHGFDWTFNLGVRYTF